VLRHCLLLGCALSVMAHAANPPRIEADVAPAWKAWSRPGRSTELSVRISSDTAARVVLDVTAGRQSLRTEVELQPGRVQRLQLPVRSAGTVAVSVGVPGAAPQRREVELALSESALLGVALLSGGQVEVDGLHTVALTADDLPRHASAYSSIDALIVDAPTLGALDPRQLGALLANTAACGRVVVVNADLPLRRLLGDASGCGGRALLHAVSPADAAAVLKASLASSLPAALGHADLGTVMRPAYRHWNGVAVGLACYFAGALLLLVFHASWPVLLSMPALTGVVALALLHGLASPSRLAIWSEGESGVRAARYQARQQFAGRVRERMRVPIPPQLADAAQACDANQVMHFDFDASHGRVAFAEFDARLFSQAAVCYSGGFPIARKIAVDLRADGRREVRNAGATAWPRGLLLADGGVHELPALGAGATTAIDANAVPHPRDAVVRTAMARVGPDATAALWELELGGVAELPAASQGWLLVATAPP